MVAGTHLLIANIVYKYLLTKMNFELDLTAFSYGSIMPDINKKYIECDHTVEGSLDIINTYSKNLVKSRIPLKEYSLALGVICHFTCDYFCLYHKKSYWKKDPLAHGIYEVTLHANFLKLLLRGNLNIIYKCKPEESVYDMIMKLQKKYNLQTEGIITDINYSIIAATSVCQLVTSEWIMKITE